MRDHTRRGSALHWCHPVACSFTTMEHQSRWQAAQTQDWGLTTDPLTPYLLLDRGELRPAMLRARNWRTALDVWVGL